MGSMRQSSQRGNDRRSSVAKEEEIEADGDEDGSPIEHRDEEQGVAAAKDDFAAGLFVNDSATGTRVEIPAEGAGGQAGEKKGVGHAGVTIGIKTKEKDDKEQGGQESEATPEDDHNGFLIWVRARIDEPWGRGKVTF